MSTARRTRRLLSATAVAAPLLAVPFAAPVAATTSPSGPRPAPPELTVAPSWLFQVEGQVDQAAATRHNLRDLSVFHRQVPVTLAWQARSRVGIDHYDVFRDDGPGTPSYLVLRGRATSYRTSHTDISLASGHLGITLYPRFTVTAIDRLGQSTTVSAVRRGPVQYEQENGTTYTDRAGSSRVFTGKPVAGPGWRTVHGDDYDGGTVLATSRRGAQLRIPIRTYHAMQVALEMTTGPRLGRVEVRIDGHRVGVVDTWARATRARVLVAQYRLEAGAHTVTLVNLGARSNATVQLDGVFVSD